MDCQHLGAQALFLLPFARKMPVFLAWFLPTCREDVFARELQSQLLGKEPGRVPVSHLSFCLCSMWGDPAGFYRKLLCTRFSEWLPFLHALHLEDIGHPRGKGRSEAPQEENKALVVAIIRVAVVTDVIYKQPLSARYCHC